MSRSAPCPQCRQPASLDPANLFRPFCSERCKLLDLGEWFGGRYGIPAVESDDGAASDDQEPDRLQ